MLSLLFIFISFVLGVDWVGYSLTRRRQYVRVNSIVEHTQACLGFQKVVYTTAAANSVWDSYLVKETGKWFGYLIRDRQY